MYRDVFLTPEEFDDAVDMTVNLKVTNAGHFKVFDGPTIKTERKYGRKDYQLIYIESGCGHFYFDGKEEIIEKDHIIIFRPKEIQLYYYYPTERAEVYWAHFTGSDVPDLLQKSGFPKSGNVFYSGHIADFPWFFQKLIEELKFTREHSDKLCCTVLQYILLTAVRHINSSNSNKSQQISEIEKAKRYFQDNYNKPISIHNYSREQLMSIDWFIKLFKKTTGQTPNQYLIELRISKAKELFETTNMNIKEVSICVGYANPLYFSRLFKASTGYNPSSYIKEYRNKLKI